MPERKEGRENPGKKGRICRNLMCLCVAFGVAKFAAEAVLEKEGLILRTWLDLSADIMIRLAVPILFVIWLRFFCRRRWVAAFGSILLGLYLLAALPALFLMAGSSYEREKILSAGMIVGRRDFGIMDDTEVYRYYDQWDLFTKRVCQDSDKIVKAVLEDRYRDTFTFTGVEGENEIYLEKEGYFSSMPELEVHVKGMLLYGRIEDDRDMAQALYRMEEYRKRRNADRKLEVERQGESGYISRLLLYCTYEEWKEGAKDAAELIACVMEDPYFSQPSHSTKLCVVCTTEPDGLYEVTLSFGNEKKGQTFDGRPMSCFGNEKAVSREMEKAFAGNPHAMPEQPESDVKTEKYREETPEEAEQRSRREEEMRIAEAEKSLLTPEGSYKKLYDTLFAPKNYGYENSYNAKGNFYAVLENGTAVLDGKELETCHTVVYDRESKNHKCQLFVEYMEYSQRQGNTTSPYRTDILEFYAVEMLTGKVCAAGKTAWEQVGNAEYREMTGE